MAHRSGAVLSAAPINIRSFDGRLIACTPGKHGCPQETSFRVSQEGANKR